jgi:hypothetical protein
MKAIDKYLTETAKNVSENDAEAQRAIVTTLEQRIACALAEARALESRHLANEFRMKISNPPEVLIRLANAMDHRADELIKHCMKLVKQYPPMDTGPEPEKKGMVTLQ